MTSISWIIFALSAVCVLDFNVAYNHVPPQEWAEYKARFKKTYINNVYEGYAQYYYAYNKRLIDRHNMQFNRGATTFKLAVNEHTDRRLIHFNAGFPETKFPPLPANNVLPAVQAAAEFYDPITDFGFMPNVENQGTVCNSGWAYSAAKAVEMLQAMQTGNMSPAPLSAQNFIDCAGTGTGCTVQVPQSAFEYLAMYEMDLHLTSNYPNNNTSNKQRMCTPRGDLVVNLKTFARLKDDDADALMAYVSNGYPVVVEMMPCTFEFMHYSTGVFQPPNNARRCSHFVLLLGYGTDSTTGLNYWLVQNSFGTSWGEKGLMRIERTPSKRVFRNAIFPTELA